jgi:gamma-glutamylcyclotransferase
MRGSVATRARRRQQFYESSTVTLVGVEELLWYFAYGSNMQRATFVARRGMRPRRSVAGYLAGYRLTFDLPVGPGERGVANLAADGAATTHGVLHLITPEEFTILDRTEGVGNGYYGRTAVTVVDREATRIEAWTYVSSRGAPGRKPSARYMGLLLEGAREHDLPVTYVRELEAIELAIDERLAK